MTENEFAAIVIDLIKHYSAYVRPIRGTCCNVLVETAMDLESVTSILQHQGYTITEMDNFYPVRLRVRKE